MPSTLSASGVACLMLLASFAAAPARAEGESVSAPKPDTFFNTDEGGHATIIAVCHALASPGASQTKVRCSVDDTLYVVEVAVPDADPQRPGNQPLVLAQQDVSVITTPGRASVAMWAGAAVTPAEVCNYAEATFNQPSGPPIVVTDGPNCRTIT